MPILQKWRQRRLSLAGLPRDVQYVGAAALAGCAAIGALTIADGDGRTPWAKEHLLREPAIPRLVIVGCYIGLGLAAAACAFAAGLRRVFARRGLLLVAGSIGAALGAETVIDARHLRPFHAGALGTADYFPHAPATTLITLGWVALVTGIGVALVPARLLVPHPRLIAAFAAAPCGFGLCAYLIALRTPLSKGGAGETVVLLEPSYPRTGGGYVAEAVIALALAFGSAVSVLFLWQLIEAARFARDSGSLARPWAVRLPLLLVLALALKLVFVALGYSGLLPAAIGGNAMIWGSSLHDGALSWLLAALFALAAAMWLARSRRHQISESQLQRGVVLIVCGLSIFDLAASALILVEPILRVLPHRPFLRSDVSLLNWLANHLQWSFVSTVYAAVLFAAVFALRRSTRTLAVFLGLFALWSLPRAIDITINLGSDSAPAGLLARALGQGDQSSVSGVGAVDLMSLDTALTVTLVVLLTYQSRRGIRINSGALLLVLIASTLSAYSGFLGNIFQSHWASLFYVGLVFPVAYEFLADSRELNESGPKRPTRLLTICGFALILMTAALALVAVGKLDQNSPTTGMLGRIMFGPPLVALLVASVIVGTPKQRG